MAKLDAIEWDPSKSVAENARQKLPLLAHAFLEAGRAAAAPRAPRTKLHPFRLQAKRLRYTLESFEKCYGPGLKLRLKALQKLQDLLGAISDCLATEQLVRERKSLTAAERNRLLKILQPVTTRRIERFREHWKLRYSKDANARWWTDYLARFAR